jgi:hypothetical protein
MDRAPVSKRRRLVLSGLLHLVAFALILRLNQMTDYTSDDLSYHFFYLSRIPTEDARLLTGPLDIPASIISHYQVQNGRSLAHALLQFFCLFPKSVFDVANTLVFLLVGHLVLWHVFRGRRYGVLQEAAVFLAMFLSIPYFGQAALWMSGSVNYLWMGAVILATLLPYRLHRATDHRPAWWKVPVAVVLGLMAGGANENSGGAWILLAVLFMLMWRWEGGGIPLWSLAGVVAAVISLAVQLASPGNATRADRLGGASWSEIVERLPALARIHWESCGLVMTVFFIVLAGYLAGSRRFGRPAAVATGYAIVGLASGLIMVVTPNIPHRSWIWTVLFLLIGIGILGRAHRMPQASARAVLVAVTAVLTIWATLVHVPAFRSIQQTHREVAEELRVVEEHKAAGNLDVVVTKFKRTTNTYNALASTPNLRAEPDATFNRWFAKFYGLNSVVVDNPEEVAR